MRLNNLPRRISHREPWVQVLFANPLLYWLLSESGLSDWKETYYFIALIALGIGVVAVVLKVLIFKSSPIAQYVSGLGINWSAMAFIISQISKEFQ